MALKRTHEQVQYIQIPDLFRTSCVRNKSRFDFHEIFLFPFFVSFIPPSRTFLILSSITAFLISLLLSSSSFLFYLTNFLPRSLLSARKRTFGCSVLLHGLRTSHPKETNIRMKLMPKAAAVMRI